MNTDGMDAARKARAKALSQMYREAEGQPTKTPQSVQTRNGDGGLQRSGASRERQKKQSSSSSVQEPLLLEPSVTLADPSQWSKTRIVNAIPHWTALHQKELREEASWIESLIDEHERRSYNASSTMPGGGSDGVAGRCVRACYSELMGREVAKAAKQNLPNMVWQATYAEIEPLMKALRYKSQSQLQPAASQLQPAAVASREPFFKPLLRHKLSRILQGMVGEYVRRVKRAVPPPHERQGSELPERVSVLHACFVALGDLHRYRAGLPIGTPTTKNKASPNHGQQTSTEASDLMAAAERYYWQALSLDVGAGKTWNQLAVCSLTAQQLAVPSSKQSPPYHYLWCACYRYFRAMTCLEPFPAKENLLSVADRLRKAVSTASSSPQHAMTAMPDHRSLFLLHLSSAAAACVSRIGLDRVMPYPHPRNADVSRLAGYLGSRQEQATKGRLRAGSTVTLGLAGGGSDSTTLFRRHLRLWAANSAAAASSPGTSAATATTSSTSHCEFESEFVESAGLTGSLSRRCVLGEAALLCVTTAHAAAEVAASRMRKASRKQGGKDDDEEEDDEAWVAAVGLVGSLLADLLDMATNGLSGHLGTATTATCLLSDTASLGAVWLLCRWLLPFASSSPTGLDGDQGSVVPPPSPSRESQRTRQQQEGEEEAEHERVAREREQWRVRAAAARRVAERVAPLLAAFLNELLAKDPLGVYAVTLRAADPDFTDYSVDQSGDKAAAAAHATHAGQQVAQAVVHQEVARREASARGRVDSSSSSSSSSSTSSTATPSDAAASVAGNALCWEVQEGNGFEGWPDAIRNRRKSRRSGERSSSSSSSTITNPTSSSSLLGHRSEPEPQDWRGLAVKLVVLACELVVSTSQPAGSGSGTPSPLFHLKRNRKGAWRFEASSPSASGSSSSSNPSRSQTGGNEEDDDALLRVDDVLSLLRVDHPAQPQGPTTNQEGDYRQQQQQQEQQQGETPAADEDGDDDEEFLLVAQPTVGDHGHRGGGGGGGDTEADDSLPSFFASAGALPPGMSADELVGALEEEAEAEGGGGEEEEANDDDVPNQGAGAPPGLPPPPSFREPSHNTTTTLEDVGSGGGCGGSGCGFGGNTGMILHGVSIPPKKKQGGGGGGGGLVGMARSHRPPSTTASSSSLPLIVLDAPNIAMRHGGAKGGGKKQFSSRGVLLTAEHFLLLGHRVVGFVPDFLLDLEKVNQRRQVQRLEANLKGKKTSHQRQHGGEDLESVKATQLPDDVQLLQALAQRGILIGTPPQDYDDSYCIRYAQRHRGFVVTNDMYRDHVSKIADRNEREVQRQWTKTNLISFTFVGDEFLPNPSFSFSS